MALSVQIGYTSSDPRVINKNINLKKAVSCNVIHANDVAHPTIELKYDADYDGCNYMYIDEFHRYYYIESITMSSATTCTIVGHSDPLMSFKAELQGRNFTIARKEKDRESYIFDEELTYPLNTETTDLVFSGGLSYGTTGRNYVLLKLR